ncbi:MAG: hypothetical protein LQ345_001050 [Seirophora villosa]|nr:MAG: hypothetical protein LQ345_001050 [Seirophora villosa]
MLLQTSSLISIIALLSHVQCAPQQRQRSGGGGGAGGVAACLVTGLCDFEDGSNTGSSSSSGSVQPASSYEAPGPGDAPANPAQMFCSADNNTAPASAGLPTNWQSEMNGCTGILNQEKWIDNSPCKAIGPNPKFYSRGKNWDSPRNCYTKCNECLRKGIFAQQAVTTWCRYWAHLDNPDGSWCEAGFWYDPSVR